MNSAMLGAKPARGTLAIGAIVLLAIGLTALWQAPRVMAASFCEIGLARDYLAPLEKLPTIQSLRWPNKDLPFGPAGLKLIKTSEAQRATPLVVLGEGARSRPVGFNLLNESFERNGAFDLSWLVSAELVRVTGRSHTVGTHTGRVGLLRRNARRRFAFPMPQRPGIYRVEISFRSQSGSRLGRIADYFRVMLPKQETQMSLSPTSVHPGETVNACLENLGTASVSYGEGFTIEVFDGSSWSQAPISPSGAVSLIGLVAGPGQRIPLGGFTIPSSATPGRYRYVWTGTVRPAQPIVLNSEFLISPAS